MAIIPDLTLIIPVKTYVRRRLRRADKHNKCCSVQRESLSKCNTWFPFSWGQTTLQSYMHVCCIQLRSDDPVTLVFDLERRAQGLRTIRLCLCVPAWHTHTVFAAVTLMLTRWMTLMTATHARWPWDSQHVAYLQCIPHDVKLFWVKAQLDSEQLGQTDTQTNATELIKICTKTHFTVF